MLKKLLIIMLLITPLINAATSEENFFSASSDFLVMTNPLSDIKVSPTFLALYDNTNIYFDINNDGKFDYKFNVDKGGPYSFETEWKITDGTRVHSDKPISYIQSFYYNSKCSSHPSHYCYLKRMNVVPPLNAFRNEYLLSPGTWNFVSNDDMIISIDENITGDNNNSIILNKTKKDVKLKYISRAYSEKPFFPYSYTGFGGILSNDFFSNEDNIMIIPKLDNTMIYFDINNDGSIDEDYNINIGMNLYKVIKGSRISSNKPIAAFGYQNGSGMVYSEFNFYHQLIPTNSVANEFIFDSTNNFILSNSGNKIVGLFNMDSAKDYGFILELKDKEDETTDYTIKDTGETISIAGSMYEGYGDVPYIDHFLYYYNHGLYISYQTGHKLAYKQIYLTAMPASKYIEPNSSSTFNVRVINPFKTTYADNIKVKFRFNTVIMPIASVNVRKAGLGNDQTIDSTSKAVTISSDENGNYFIFTYDDILESETYLDINFNLLMPNKNTTINFEPAELTYKAETWII